MNRVLVGVLLLAVGLLASGCVGNVPMNYAPSSTMSASGSVSVSGFAYLPGQNGRVKPNQIRTTAIGAAKFEQNVDQIFRDALFKELRFMGIKVENPDRALTGEIEEFLADDLGYSITWTLRVKYRVTTGGSETYAAVKEIKRKTSKFANALGALNETIKLNIEELVLDQKFIEAIRS